jgi:type I restriction enzyme S subunit
VTPLPLGWSWVTLDDLQADEPAAITDGPFGSHLTSAHYRDNGPRVVRLQNIGDGVFHDARAHIASDHFAQLRRHEVKPGDLLVASLGERLPRACLAPATLGPAIVKADCIRVRLHDRVESRWVLYAMQTSAIRAYAADQLHGVGRPRLGLKVIRSLPIPLPPLDEQRRIVDILEDHLSRLDAATKQLHDVVRRSNAWAAALVDESLQAVPESAPVAHLLREPMRNGHSARGVAGGGIRTLTLTAVTRGEFTDEHTKLTDADPRRVKDLWLTSGDILVQRSNTAELVGTSARYTGPDAWAIYPDLMIRLRPDESRVLSPFLASALASERVHRSMRARAKGLAGSMPKIDQETIGSTLVPLPDLETQRRLVERIGVAKAQANRLAADAQRGVRSAAALRRSLLDAAFSGRL